MESLPGIPIDAVGGASFGRAQVEWVLPPLRFRRVGIPSMYLRWASLSVFMTGLWTDPGVETEQVVGSVGGQLDFRFVSFSHMNSTLSIGYGVAIGDGGHSRDEFMISLRLL